VQLTDSPVDRSSLIVNSTIPAPNNPFSRLVHGTSRTLSLSNFITPFTIKTVSPCLLFLEPPSPTSLLTSPFDVIALYLALDFHPGGDLATQLARWGRLGRDRARFYASEICEGVEGLHRAGIIYRDLKPENVLISANGHVVLTDFGESHLHHDLHFLVEYSDTWWQTGLSKDFGHSAVAPPTSTLRDELPRPHWLSAHPVSRSASTPPATISSFNRRETTSTFCGTAEYLAPGEQGTREPLHPVQS